MERSYVVIIPGTVPGDELKVEIQMVKQNFSMAEIVVAGTERDVRKYYYTVQHTKEEVTDGG